MGQRTRDTDAFILMQFVGKTKHLLASKPTREVQAEMATLGRPYLRALQANGHDLQACADLMRAAHGLPQRPVGHSG